MDVSVLKIRGVSKRVRLVTFLLIILIAVLTSISVVYQIHYFWPILFFVLLVICIFQNPKLGIIVIVVNEFLLKAFGIPAGRMRVLHYLADRTESMDAELLSDANS